MNNKFKFLLICLTLSFVILELTAYGQGQNQIIVEGYVYEENNRGYLNYVEIKVFNPNSDTPIATAISECRARPTRGMLGGRTDVRCVGTIIVSVAVDNPVVPAAAHTRPCNDGGYLQSRVFSFVTIEVPW